MNQRKYAKVGGASRQAAKKSRKGRRLPEAGWMTRRETSRREPVDAGKARFRSVCVAWDEGAADALEAFREKGAMEWEKSPWEGSGPDERAASEGLLSWEDWAELPLEGYDEDLTPDRDRAFSRQTVYLVHKWLEEGMPLPMVARILNRSVENVRAAAEVPLLKGEKALLRRYFAPFRMRKETD